MSNNFRHLYITTPLFYPSDKLHLGHAFTLLMSDVLKKYYQLLNFDVFLLTGSDEHGEKILKKSIEQNVQPIELVDKNVDYFKKLCVSLKIDYDSFVRTSTDKHKSFVQKSFSVLLKNKKIYSKQWSGNYCVSCEENYSTTYKVCKLGHDLSTKNEESFFCKLNDSVDLLKDFYSKKKPDISPSWHIQELNNSFLIDLEDLSITRKNLKWGVQTLEYPDFTVYVWFDALLGYISGDAKIFEIEKIPK